MPYDVTHRSVLRRASLGTVMYEVIGELPAVIGLSYLIESELSPCYSAVKFNLEAKVSLFSLSCGR